jgi:DNA-binding response OmpR family regulator
MMYKSISTVIVADPDPYYQQQIAYLLRESFRCIPASTLREAYHLIQREHPFMLTLELNQSDGDGLTLIQYLQADPALRPTLIACVTARAGMMDKIRAFRAGADDYLTKPISHKTFYGQMLMLKRTGHMARAFVAR